MSTANQTIKAAGSLAISWQLAQPAMAHNGVSHGQKQEEDSLEESQSPNTTEPEPIDSSTYAPDVSTEITTVESIVEADISESKSVNVSLADHTIGLGEILFGLILIFPWLLIALRKQLHFSTRS